MLLENPAENGCFGCGPANPRSLGLAFDHDAERGTVRTTYTPREDETGWPGLVHTGLHYLVLFEASYWAAIALAGTVHTPQGPQTFESTRLPRTGRAFVVEARRVAEEPFTTRAESRTEDGRRCGALEVAWRPASRAQAARAGIALPAYLLEHMAP